MARITIDISAQTSDDSWSDYNHCGVQLKLADGNPEKVELYLSERTDKLYINLAELRKSLAVLAAQDE